MGLNSQQQKTQKGRKREENSDSTVTKKKCFYFFNFYFIFPQENEMAKEFLSFNINKSTFFFLSFLFPFFILFFKILQLFIIYVWSKDALA